MGDALCSFNPIFGQGMTVSALEAKLLSDCLKSLEARGTPSLEALTCNFREQRGTDRGRCRGAWRPAKTCASRKRRDRAA